MVLSISIFVFSLVLLPKVSGHIHDVIKSLAVSKDGNWLFTVSRTNLLRSKDGGESWKSLRDPYGYHNAKDSIPESWEQLILSPNFEIDRTLVFGKYLSTDAGTTWERKWSSNLGRKFESCGDTFAFSSDFSTDMIIYVVGYDGTNSRLMFSKNLGKTFKLVATLNSWNPGVIPQSKCAVLTATTEGVYLGVTRLDGSSTIYRNQKGSTPDTWKEIFEGFNVNIQQIIDDQSGGGTKILLIDDKAQELYQMDTFYGTVLDEDALTVVPLPNPTSKIGKRRLVTAYVHKGEGNKTSMIVLRSVCPTKLFCEVKEGARFTDDYVLRSQNNGVTWEKLHIEDWFQLNGGGTSIDFSTREFSSVASVHGTSRIFLGAFTGIYRSDDNGKSWKELDTITHTITGMSVTKASGQHVHLSVGTYHGFCWTGVVDLKQLLHGINPVLPNGSMKQLVIPPPFQPGETYNRVVFSPTVKDTEIAFYTIPFSNKDDYRSNAIFRSTDGFEGGLYIDPAINPNTSLVELPTLRESGTVKVHVIKYSPNFETDGTVFIGGLNIGICRSTDYGLTFETIFSVYNEVPNTMVVKLIISPDYARDRLLAALVINVPERNTVVFISKSSGSTWKQIRRNEKIKLTNISFTINNQHKRFSKYSLVGILKDGSIRVSKPLQKNFRVWKPLLYQDGSGKYVAKLPEYAMGDTGEGTGFSRDAILGTPDGKLIMGLLVGGIVQGKLFNNKFRDVEVKGKNQRWTFASEVRLVESHSKSFQNMIAISPDYMNDGILFGANYNEIYASVDKGETW
eukprot:CAMPEP_0194272436 /NCGR_PEP_ID=MMETSP0169-20130528/6008_1 /TAXON_ID=218684 /ORGANISM="Corethron pennatum, Strain L29A3" /LENGTH=791 /DNA_ID=CAMNT_0039015101 /DNA_START=306 /DNA_END=2678 /DNA_ORIENTATION=+